MNRGFVTVAALLVASGCGPSRSAAQVTWAAIEADGEVAPLAPFRVTPSSGPLLDVPVCGQDFTRRVASLARYEAEAGARGSLFRDFDATDWGQCATAITSVTTACAGSPPPTPTTTTARAALYLNECVVVASGDPKVGAARVRSALDMGWLPHAASDPECPRAATIAARTLRALPNADGVNMVLGGLDEARATECLAIVDAVAQARTTSCTDLGAYQLDACLVDVEFGGRQSRLLSAAVAGQGTWAHRLLTAAPKAEVCRQKPLDVLAASAQATGADPAGATLKFLAADGTPLAPPADAPAARVIDVAARLGNDADVRASCEEVLAAAKRDQTCSWSVEQIRALDVCTVARSISFSKQAALDDYEWTILARDAATAGYANTFPSPSVEFRATASLPPAEQAAAGPVINGLADFLISRAKQEVEAFVADEVVAQICARAVAGVAVRSYFPATCRLLQGRFLDGATGVRSFGMTLKRTLEDDLLGLWPVLLNAGARWRGDAQIAPIAQVLIEVLATPGATDTPAALMRALAAARCTSTGGSDVGCVVRIVGLTWSGKAPAEIAQDPELADRIAQLLPDKLEVRLARLADALAAVRARDLDAFALLAELPAALRALDMPALATAVEHHLAKLGGLATGLPQLATVIYRVGRAVVRGENPARIFIGATSSITCGGETDDLRCALVLSRLTVAAVLETREQWPRAARGGGDLDRYARDIEQRLARIAATDPHLTAWAKHRFGGLASIALSGHLNLDIHAFTTGFITSIIALDQLLVPPAAASAADQQVADQARVQQLFAAGATFFRVIVEQAVSNPTLKRAALATIDRSGALVAAGYRRDLPEFVAELYGLATALGMPEPLPASMRDNVTLVTALASARTAADVKLALEKHAAPVGGYKDKHVKGRHGSVSALVGLGGGYEWGVGQYDAADANSAVGDAGQLSLFAPIGLDATVGEVAGLRGVGLFASVIDIGSVASVRLANNAAAELPDPTWAQVISPGLFVRAGTRWTGPFVLAGGASYAPYAREDANGDRHGVLRLSIFASVDITLMPL